ncbi:hypothetical protein [Nonomuraea sediminis]|uniref:hypothetical protein n=1 Tax=Nonomuraea sediminis TaxID=2835864 RepID=UPI001BDC4B10|nr:hypothetical protein [Nonomuraea sediminis]
MPDVYPADLLAEIRDLKRRVEQLEASRGSLTAASKGWLMSDMAIPSVSSGQIQIGCNGGDFYVKTSSTVKRIPGVAASVAAVSTTDAGSTYTTSVQTLINELKTKLNAFISNNKSAGQMQGP